MELDLQFFGGRGASSHRSGSKSGGSGGSLDKFKLPTLEGSVKQIAWAKDIWKGAVGDLAAFDKEVKEYRELKRKSESSLSSTDMAKIRQFEKKTLPHQISIWDKLGYVAPFVDPDGHKGGNGVAAITYGNSFFDVFKTNKSFNRTISDAREYASTNGMPIDSAKKTRNSYVDTFAKKYGPKSGETWTRGEKFGRIASFLSQSMRDRLRKEKDATWYIDNRDFFNY